MALTVEQINAHINHFNVYRELPREAMDELFATALTVAQASEKVDEAVEAKPKRVAKAKE